MVLSFPPHERKSHYADPECIRHRRELRMVREVGLEEALGLGRAAYFRGGRVRRMRDFSLSGSARGTRPRGERRHLRTGRRRNGRQGRLDVGVGCGRG